MKRPILFFSFCLIIAATVTGCYKDVNLPIAAADPNGPPQQLSFKNDVAPILNTNCALSGCHVAGAQKPDLRAAVSYISLVNGGYVNTLVPNQSILYVMINGNMQEHIPSAVDRKKVYDWIRTGALNN
ncbi:hypothetical protein [Mucilaginibacter sp.]|uniref:hypothetical protein n=1 Tax=Mucilaginibacter sp. TaxID=1882438 RepID=UPI002620D64A|nr:hypothetical protein [Mucilaginibacter sp.]MDB5031627.1 hypothetical protein [Mucilaginibacter sp.]